ncbi:carbohydrate ABC transporter permease [Kineococcus sp. SYSU DK001]|uniref:carbohydrate ABC transporter permease n=1 Tax=Kineococcus sp. SYSU DK001 TaxID=3383122 RepID=UPI003D7E1A9A
MATTTRTTGTAADRLSVQRRPRKRVDPTFFLFLLPTITLFTLFITVPALLGAGVSLTNYIGFGDFDVVGFSNFKVLFTDPNIREAYGFTLLFALVTVILTNVIALLLALGLNAKIHAKTFLRSVFFIPMVVSGIVIAFVFNYLFSTSIPQLFEAVPALQTSLLANPDWAWFAVVIVTTWQAVPGAMIIYIAGLLAVPDEVYEAAALDGAGASRQFFSVTLPLMWGYVIINTVLGFKGFLSTYDIIVGLTDGGPGTATRSVSMVIFSGFTNGDYSYQMANALVFFVLTVVISILQLQLIRRRGVQL